MRSVYQFNEQACAKTCPVLGMIDRLVLSDEKRGILLDMARSMLNHCQDGVMLQQPPDRIAKCGDESNQRGQLTQVISDVATIIARS